MEISLVIRAKNEAQGLEKLLPALNNQSVVPSEIVLVDDSSMDNTVSIANKYGAKVVPLGNKKFSYGRALNIGFQNAKGDVLVSIPGHSMPVTSHWLEKLIEPFTNPKVAATYGSQIAQTDANTLEKIERFLVGNINFNTFYPYLVNTNSSIRKSVWEKVHFNEEIAADEDHLWARQVAKLGFKITFVPQAKIWHSHHGSSFNSIKRYTKEGWNYIKILGGRYN